MESNCHVGGDSIQRDYSSDETYRQSLCKHESVNLYPEGHRCLLCFDGFMSRKEITDILMAEYKYWRSVDDTKLDGIAVGAVGAVSNVIAAIYGHKSKHLERK